LKRKFEFVAGSCIACYLKCAHRVCDVIIASISRGTFPTLTTIFLLASDYIYTTVGNTFISHSCRVTGFSESPLWAVNWKKHKLGK